MLEFTDEQFKDVKTKGEAFYKSIGEIYCPYFKEKISFEAQGLEHLKFKRRGKSRSEKDQYMRLKLIHLAPEILKMSHTVQGIFDTKKFEHIKTNNRWEYVQKEVSYFEFIAVIKRNRCKVVVKKVGQGKMFFWSIIPFWGMNKETMIRVLYEGEPEED